MLHPLLFIVLLDVIEQADTSAAAATDNTDINADGEITEQVNKEIETVSRSGPEEMLSCKWLVLSHYHNVA